MLQTILCIDDDPITLMLYKKVISRTSFSQTILTMPNGEAALQFFDSIKENGMNTQDIPQLIFLDLNMPVMDGWDFLNYFETEKFKDFNNIKVVILSSTIDPADLAKAKKYPMVIDFLPKPINLPMLEQLTNKLK